MRHATTAGVKQTMSYSPHLEDWLDDEIASLRDAVENGAEAEAAGPEAAEPEAPAERESNGRPSALPLQPARREESREAVVREAPPRPAPREVPREPVAREVPIPAVAPRGRRSLRRRVRRTYWRMRWFLRKRSFGLFLYGSAFAIAIAVAWLVASRA